MTPLLTTAAAVSIRTNQRGIYTTLSSTIHRAAFLQQSPWLSWSTNNPHSRTSSTVTTLPRSPSYPPAVRVVEVGPRDGLQNESVMISTSDKVRLIQLLVKAGCRHVEAGSFVSPAAIPALADSLPVLQQLQTWRTPLKPENNNSLVLSCLVPNLKGWQHAQRGRPDEVALFAAASESFSQRNLNCSIAESLVRYQQVADAVSSSAPSTRLRGYVSCVFACPYEGAVAPHQVARVVDRLLRLGCTEVSLGDTIGVGTVRDTRRLLDELVPWFGSERLALHCHDTYGQAVANIVTSLEYGITTIDAAVAGLGGCPYARGATGNVATEDVVYLLNGLGVTTGIDLDSLVDAGVFIMDKLGRTTQSKTAQAILAKRKQRASDTTKGQ